MTRKRPNSNLLGSALAPAPDETLSQGYVNVPTVLTYFHRVCGNAFRLREYLNTRQRYDIHGNGSQPSFRIPR